MASALALWLGFGAMVVMLAAVVGTVERRERYAFVLGVALMLVGLTLVTAPRALSVLLVVGGLVAIGASVVPLLVEPA